jgi:glycerol-3-phosphate acyltransferase PlsY
MDFWIAKLAGLVGAYLLGSIPTAYLVGKRFYGLDIRELGSKSVGATNALRVLGKWPALAVLLIDILKGVAAVVLARWIWSWFSTLDQQPWAAWAISLAGIAALLGHGWSIWLRFSGGKSVATGLGVVLALSWPVALGALAVFGVVVAVFRIVSLGSILAAWTAIVLICVLDEPTPYRLLIIAGGLYVVGRHRANLTRLLAGTEPRIGRSLRR